MSQESQESTQEAGKGERRGKHREAAGRNRHKGRVRALGNGHGDGEKRREPPQPPCDDGTEDQG